MDKPTPQSAVALRNDCVKITHLPEKALLLLKWCRQITFTERRDTFLWAYDFSKKHGVKNWLLDDEHIFIITPEEKEWVTHTWTELVASSDIAKIAVVTSDHFPNLLANADFTTTAQEKYRHHGATEHEVFTDYHLAYQWLTEGY